MSKIWDLVSDFWDLIMSYREKISNKPMIILLYYYPILADLITAGK